MGVTELQARNAETYQKLEGARKDSLLELLEGTSPDNTSVLDSCPPEL